MHNVALMACFIFYQDRIHYSIFGATRHRGSKTFLGINRGNDYNLPANVVILTAGLYVSRSISAHASIAAVNQKNVEATEIKAGAVAMFEGAEVAAIAGRWAYPNIAIPIGK